MLQAAKTLGARLAKTGLTGAGVGIGTVFGCLIFNVDFLNYLYSIETFSNLCNFFTSIFSGLVSFRKDNYILLFIFKILAGVFLYVIMLNRFKSIANNWLVKKIIFLTRKSLLCLSIIRILNFITFGFCYSSVIMLWVEKLIHGPEVFITSLDDSNKSGDINKSGDKTTEFKHKEIFDVIKTDDNNRLVESIIQDKFRVAAEKSRKSFQDIYDKAIVEGTSEQVSLSRENLMHANKFFTKQYESKKDLISKNAFEFVSAMKGNVGTKATTDLATNKSVQDLLKAITKFMADGEIQHKEKLQITHKDNYGNNRNGENQIVLSSGRRLNVNQGGYVTNVYGNYADAKEGKFSSTPHNIDPKKNS